MLSFVLPQKLLSIPGSLRNLARLTCCAFRWFVGVWYQAKFLDKISTNNLLSDVWHEKLSGKLPAQADAGRYDILTANSSVIFLERPRPYLLGTLSPNLRRRCRIGFICRRFHIPILKAPQLIFQSFFFGHPRIRLLTFPSLLAKRPVIITQWARL